MSEEVSEKKSGPERKHVLGSMVKNAQEVKAAADDKEEKPEEGQTKEEGKKPERKKKELSGQHEERVNHTVTFDLTEDDFAKKGKDAAKLQGEINDLEREFNAVKEEYKAKTSLLEGECSMILATIRRGKEEREVTVTKLIDFDRGIVEFWYMNKIVETRGIKPEERQGKMF